MQTIYSAALRFRMKKNYPSRKTTTSIVTSTMKMKTTTPTPMKMKRRW